MKSPAFAKQLRKLRRQLGISQEAMGQQWGVSRERVSHYERQQEIPASRLLFKLNEKFGVNCFEWLSVTNPSPTPTPPKYQIQITHNSSLPIGNVTKGVC